MNYKNLIYWLIDNTEINNENTVSNKEIKSCFLNSFPEYNSIADNIIAFKIGLCLNLIYDAELIKIKNDGLIHYNIQICN